MRKGDELTLILNSVDDHLYLSTSETLRKKFEEDIADCFHVDLMGQAHWYLQSRILQEANFDIVVDQSRYIVLILARFLPLLGVEAVTEPEKKRYAAPLPCDFVATKKDKSENYLEVAKLQEEFGFEYASVIGMLIYLMNTAFSLHFAVTKLAKFNNLPGRKHFKAVHHLLRHLRCHHQNFGIRYYSEVKRSPIYKLVKENTSARPYAPLIMFVDSSWQDCPDTSRSTGCFLLYQQGGIVDGGSFVPNPIALSSAEAEYNALAYAMQKTVNTRQILHEMHGNHPDTPLNIPFLCDSESALIIADNNRDTKRTRHIQRRIHYDRDGIASGAFTGFKIDGKVNPADTGTKNLSADELDAHKEVMHVHVSP